MVWCINCIVNLGASTTKLMGQTIKLLGPPAATGTLFKQNGEVDKAHTRNWTHELKGDEAWLAKKMGVLQLLSEWPSNLSLKLNSEAALQFEMVIRKVLRYVSMHFERTIAWQLIERKARDL